MEEAIFEDNVAVNHYYIIDINSGSLTHYTTMHHAYTEAAYRALDGSDNMASFFVLVAERNS